MPTTSETIIWTALPYGRTATTLKLSAMVTFQLSGDTNVLNANSFPTAANWDATKLKFEVHVNGIGSAIVPTATSQGTVDPTLWKMFVPSQTPPPLISWDKHIASATAATISSFDASAVGAFLTHVNASHVITAFGYPITATERIKDPMIHAASLPTLRSLNSVKLDGKQKAPGLRSHIKAKATEIIALRQKGTPPASLEDQLVEARHFFEPRQTSKAQPQFPDIDFHRAMAMLGQHPKLLRLFGVVVDLEIPATGLPANGQIYLKVSGMAGDAKWQFPHTVFELGSDFFRAMSRPALDAYGKTSSQTEIANGYMNMNPDLVSVGNVDVSGGLMKMTNFAVGLAEKADEHASLLTTFTPELKGPTRETDTKPAAIHYSRFATTIDATLLKVLPSAGEPANPPYSRTSGITVYRRNRAAAYTALRSLAYHNYNALAGDVNSGSATSNVAPLYAEDLMKGWRPDILALSKQNPTWQSLVRRTNFYKVGSKVIGPLDDESQISTALSSDSDAATTKFLHEAIFSWMGWSLATPKVGQPLKDDGTRASNLPPTNAGEASTYIQNYVVNHSHYPLSTVAFTPAGALPTLRYGSSYAVRARYVDLAGNSVDWSSMAPGGATTSQSTVYLRQEPIGPPTLFPRVDPGRGASGFTLVVRKYADGHFDQTDMRLMAPSLGDVSHAELHGELDTPAGTPDPAMYSLIQQFDQAPSLPKIIPGSGAPPHLPYLPDPAAQGACLAPNSNVPFGANLMSFYSGASWPQPNWGQITLTAGATGASTASGTAFAVTLAPGQRVYFGLSSTTTESFLTEFSQTWAVENALRSAGMTMATYLGSRSPKAASRLKSYEQHSPFSVSLQTKLNVNLTPIKYMRHVDTGPSPEQIYVTSLLNGRNAAFTPPTVVTMIHATQVPEPGLMLVRIAANRDADSTRARFTAITHVHGWSTEEVEYFLTHEDDVDELSEPKRITTEKTISNRAFTVPVPYQDTSPVYELPIPDPLIHEFHDTKMHKLNVKLVAKSRYTSCFPASWQTDGMHAFTVSAPGPAPVIVPSSRRPDPVAVEAIFPLFNWSKSAQGNTSSSARKGNMLRIYLRRPWFSSGNGEQLAVILAKDLGSENELPQFATLLGTDPAFKNAAVTKFLSPEHFANRASTASDALANAPQIKESAQPVVAALYNPVFDDYHQMWVVDVEIDPPSRGVYTPFLRLALARYQQQSIANCNVSSITLTDITQLHADRLAVLQVIQPRTSFTVSVTASAVAESAMGKNIVVGTLEQQVGLDPETGWTPARDGSNNIIENNVPLNEFQLILERAASNINAVDTLTATSEISRSRLVNRKPSDFRVSKEVLTTINANIVKQPNGPGYFSVPDPSKTYRIVLREYELHLGGSYEPFVKGAPAGPNRQEHVVGRLVHVDTIAVP